MENQQNQTQVMADIMEESRIRRHDRMFQNTPVFDGKDPTMFNDWTERLELACSLSGRDITRGGHLLLSRTSDTNAADLAKWSEGILGL